MQCKCTMLQLGSLVGCTTTLNGQVMDKGLGLVCGAPKHKISNTYRLIISLHRVIPEGARSFLNFQWWKHIL
jgi:hypothetical protein